MHPDDIAHAIRDLRAATLRLLDERTEAELETEALPGWTVLDVLRHLADSDRRSVLGVHVLEFLPGRDLLAFERTNDDNLSRLAGADRRRIRDELDRWGGRFATLVRLVPAPVGRLRVPTAFGTVPVAWMGALRLYDEWVHQWDITRALGLPDPPMDERLRRLLAEFQLIGLAAGPVRARAGTSGVVEVVVPDGGVPAWRVDLPSGEAGADVVAAPTATITIEVAAFCLVAGARRPWRELDAVTVTGSEPGAAEDLLDLVRVI